MLEVRGLTKRFGGLTAVKDLSFDRSRARRRDPRPDRPERLRQVDRDEDRSWASSGPTAGEVDRGRGRRLAAHKIARLGVGMVFQHSRPLHRQTVLENIMVALLPDSLFMLFRRQGADRARQMDRRARRPRRVMDRRPPTLPFADLRRLELAKAIARDPKVVLVDEPFAGLTWPKSASFSELIRSFRDEGRAVLLVDHNVKSVARWSTACWRCISASDRRPAAPTR
jgi:branched-chain amino acid transport system ATP-binding protein